MTMPGPANLSCDVLTVLQSQCASCHGDPPVGGAPMSLLTYADLTAKSKSDPSKTVAEVSVLRMQDAARPMPPGGGASASDIAAIQRFIDGGFMMGTCDDAGANPYDTPTVCTSMQTNHFASGRELMHPGGMCNTCHAQQGVGVMFTIAGTVYPTAHEPDDCFGASGSVSGAKVLILDMNGNTQQTLTPNARGNFTSLRPIKTPYTAKVVVGTSERAMTTPQTNGECNACHTEQGTSGAPGRIMLP